MLNAKYLYLKLQRISISIFFVVQKRIKEVNETTGLNFDFRSAPLGRRWRRCSLDHKTPKTWREEETGGVVHHHQTKGDLGSVVNSHSGVRGRVMAENDLRKFLVYLNHTDYQ